MFLQIWSSLGGKIVGEETPLLLLVFLVKYISPLNARVRLSWWAVFSIVVCTRTKHDQKMEGVKNVSENGKTFITYVPGKV
jgi:hypothetical protein